MWFCCSDFIPRSLPTLAFIFLMRTKRPPAKDMKLSVTHKAGGQDEFQFVQLADDDSFYNLSDLDRSNSISSTTEVMLNAAQFAPDSKRSLTPGDAIVSAPNKKAGQFNKMHHLQSLEAGQHGHSSHQLLPGPAQAHPGRGQHAGGHTTMTSFDASGDEDDSNDDDFYSLDDEDWNGEPSLIDKFFSAITFSATHKAADHTHNARKIDAHGKNSNKDPGYDSSDMRL
jgi:hypothetical protein